MWLIKVYCCRVVQTRRDKQAFSLYRLYLLYDTKQAVEEICQYFTEHFNLRRQYLRDISRKSCPSLPHYGMWERGDKA